MFLIIGISFFVLPVLLLIHAFATQFNSEELDPDSIDTEVDSLTSFRLLAANLTETFNPEVEQLHETSLR